MMASSTKARASLERSWKSFDKRPVGDPTKAWQRLAVKQPFETAFGNQGPTKRQGPLREKPEGHLRFVCISDTHGLTDRIAEPVPHGDVLLHAGDFSNTGKLGEVVKFGAFMRALPHKHKIVIAGNHDLSFDRLSYPTTGPRFGHEPLVESSEALEALEGCTYLEDEAVTVQGIKIYGSPWQPWFHDWAFNVERGEAIRQKWKRIPSDTDILMTHGPPIGHGDLLFPSGERSGCVDLLREVQLRVQPKFHVFGHIHEAYGQTTDGFTQFINASTCDYRYTPHQPPIVFDMPLPTPDRGDCAGV